MLERIPTQEELQSLFGKERLTVWNAVCTAVESLYDMDRLWNNGGKKWVYEYKYRRGGKTLCTLYAKENCFGFMVIFGKDERAKFESDRDHYSDAIQTIYDTATTYHDGKWMMIELNDLSLIDDITKLLAIKRKPNKKD